MRRWATAGAALGACLGCATVPPPSAFWTDAWGAAPAVLGSLRPVASDPAAPPAVCYERAEDERRLLDVAVERIHYCFFEEGLWSVRASTRDAAAARILFERFCEEVGAEPEPRANAATAYEACERSRGGVRSTALLRADALVATVERVHEERDAALAEVRIDAERDAALGELMRE